MQCHKVATPQWLATTHGATTSVLQALRPEQRRSRVRKCHTWNQWLRYLLQIKLVLWTCSSRWNLANSLVTNWFIWPSNSRRSSWAITKQHRAFLCCSCSSGVSATPRTSPWISRNLSRSSIIPCQWVPTKCVPMEIAQSNRGHRARLAWTRKSADYFKSHQSWASCSTTTTNRYDDTSHDCWLDSPQAGSKIHLKRYRSYEGTLD